MSFSANYPTISPSLLLDFANSNTVDPRVTFTRASTATYFNSIGSLTTAAINAPRLDYNPSTLAAQGLLIEEQRTNIVRSSVYTTNANGWTNGVIGGTGTIAAAAVNSPAGTTAGVFNVSGLDGSSYVGNFSIITSSTIARTGSIFVKNTGGVKFQIRLVYQTGGTFLAYGTEYDFSTGLFQDGIAGTTAPTSRSATNVGNGWIRITITGSDNGTGNTNNALAMYGSTTTSNYNYLIWGAQVEEASGGTSAAFATSVIPTTTAAVTRSADVASVNTLSPWYNATEGTLYAEISAAAGFNVTGNFGRFAGIQDALSSNNIEMFFDGSLNQAPRYRVRSGGVNQAIGNSATAYTANTVLKASLAYAVNDFSGVSRGVVDLTDTSGVVPVGVTFLSLGSEGGGSNFINGYLRRITYYPRRLTNAELQAITA